MNIYHLCWFLQTKYRNRSQKVGIIYLCITICTYNMNSLLEFVFTFVGWSKNYSIFKVGANGLWIYLHCKTILMKIQEQSKPSKAKCPIFALQSNPLDLHKWLTSNYYKISIPVSHGCSAADGESESELSVKEVMAQW